MADEKLQILQPFSCNRLGLSRVTGSEGYIWDRSVTPLFRVLIPELSPLGFGLRRLYKAHGFHFPSREPGSGLNASGRRERERVQLWVRLPRPR